jgi:hypothetical protein
MKESTVEDYLVEQVEARGGFCPKTVWLGRKGCPDREVVWPWGDIDKVETKRPKGGRYEAGQKQAHKEYAERGVPVYLLNTKEKVDVYVQARSVCVHLDALFSVPVQAAFCEHARPVSELCERCGY